MESIGSAEPTWNEREEGGSYWQIEGGCSPCLLALTRWQLAYFSLLLKLGRLVPDWLDSAMSLLALVLPSGLTYLAPRIDVIDFQKDANTHINRCSPLLAPLTRMGLYALVKLRVKWQRYDLRKKERSGGENGVRTRDFWRDRPAL